jgi:hypothetical protein
VTNERGKALVDVIARSRLEGFGGTKVETLLAP